MNKENITQKGCDGSNPENTAQVKSNNKKRIIAEYEGKEFTISVNTRQTVSALATTRFAIMEKNGYNEDSIVQVFNADVFRVEKCCGGNAVDDMCVCK